MPKSRFSEYAKNARTKAAPPIDWAFAAFLERRMVLGYDLKELSEVACMSYVAFRQLARRSPWTWPDDVRERIGNELGITFTRSVEGAPRNDWGKE